MEPGDIPDDSGLSDAAARTARVSRRDFAMGGALACVSAAGYAASTGGVDPRLADSQLAPVIPDKGVLDPTKTEPSPISRADFVSVADFGADRTGKSDSSLAFTQANAASCANGVLLYAPAGDYLLKDWRPLNGTVFRGAGFGSVPGTTLRQMTPDKPVLSFIPNGIDHFSGLDFDGFRIIGHSAAKTCAVLFQTSGISAIWRSRFRFAVSKSYQAFRIDSSPGTNFFDNEVEIHSAEHVVGSEITSGTYNRYRFFITECGDSVALIHGGVNDKFEHFVADGQLRSSGLNTVFLSPAVEHLFGKALPAAAACIDLAGSRGATLLNPTVILPQDSAEKCTFAFRPGARSTFISPFVRSIGKSVLAHSFAVSDPRSAVDWTLQGGSSNCTHKLEAIYDGRDEVRSLRRVHLVGDVSDFVTSGPSHGDKVTQFHAPGGAFSLDVDPNADILIIKPGSSVPVAQFNIVLGLTDGRVITFTTIHALKTIKWVSTANTALLPTALNGGGKLSIVYHAADKTFYPIG